MKKSRILFKVLVVLIIATALLIPSTFSWYNHNGSQIGNKMIYSRNNLPVSAGTINVETKKFYMDSEKKQGGDVNKVYYDQKGNKEYNGGTITSGEVTKETTQYYGTTITNSGSAPAYVNLYLENFTNDPNNFIGTLQPSLTHKNLSSSVHLTNKNFIRIYFQWANANNWKDPSAKHYLVYTTKNGTTGNIEIKDNNTENPDSDKIEKGAADSELLARQTSILGADNIENTYYVNLPDDTVEFFFATDGNNSGFNSTNNTVTMPWYRTRTITNVQAETGYYLINSADDTTFNAQYGTFNISGGVSVKTYFNTATINKSQHAYVTLNKGTNYTGASTAYRVSSGSGITVNGNTGYVTADSGLSSGNDFATVTTTITGSLGDTAKVETKFSNPSKMPSAAVALNVEVPAATDVGLGKTEIVWYIQNKSADSCEFDKVYYTK